MPVNWRGRENGAAAIVPFLFFNKTDINGGQMKKTKKPPFILGFVDKKEWHDKAGEMSCCHETFFFCSTASIYVM